MAVKPGYKQTEVGIIPEEWEVVEVEKLVEQRALAKPLDGNHGNIHPKSSDYVYHGIPFVMANNFSNGHVNFENCKFITKERADKLQKGFSVSGDVLLTHKGTVGSTAIVGELSTDYIMLTPQVTYYRVLDANSLNNSFLRHYFDSQSFQSLFTSLAGGGTRAYLGIVKQLALPIIMPPIEEQRAIAAVLSDVDALLGALERLISKKRDLKQAAMQQLLTGQTRLPGFDGEWEVKLLGEIAHIKTGSRNNEDKVEDGQYPFFVRSEFVERISSYSYDCEAILVPGEGRIGDIFHYINGRFDVHQRVYAITKFLPDISGRFIYFYLSKNFGAWAMQNTVKATVDSLRLPTFLTFEMMLPPTKAEQIAITSVLADMDAELAALEQRLSKTRTLKQGMMQELLTGRTRLL
ncbi:restriction endonuclease subunit S [Pseudomonas mandelii]